MAYAARMHAGLPTGTPTAPDSAQRSGAPSTDADLGSLVVDLRSV